ncbi:type VII secretion protein EccE [Amycolatopsis sp. WQ 127309]|uniref:type VII secretion protein EccE n=1 Tax=Amycolatopsis sp. WQ 127309 TaxID=2932773 RepID=UPI001FF19DA9|nr:type VII secretion protein EccE [Amycolatopsis sp. WQ 127309]UOZ11200.1 type VII secretion protein EccE [Amycolatopsis sp. WQ 127309]
MSVGTAESAVRPAPPRPARAPLPWLLPIRPLQAAVWEVAAIAALLAWTVGGLAQPVRIGVSAAAGLVVLLTSVRFAGRHPAGWTLTWIAYRLRRHDTRHDSPDPLMRVAGPVKVRQHVDRAGNRFGVAEVDGGWSALVRLTPGSGSPSSAALVDILRAAYRRTDVPLASAQLLTWAVPRGDQVLRVRWLAVRYRPDLAPIAALARGGGDLGALRSTASAALSLMGELAEAGYPSTVLEAGELGQELRVALGVQGPSAAQADHWRAWTWGEASQMCFMPRSVRTLDVSVPEAAFTATSYTLRRTAAGKEHEELTIRVGGRPGKPVPSPGHSAVPLHGRHGAGVRRTLPLALDS